MKPLSEVVDEKVQLIRLLSLYDLSFYEIEKMNIVARKIKDDECITDMEIWELYVKDYEAQV